MKRDRAEALLQPAWSVRGHRAITRAKHCPRPACCRYEV
jgi:hypothetical protein